MERLEADLDLRLCTAAKLPPLALLPLVEAPLLPIRDLLLLRALLLLLLLGARRTEVALNRALERPLLMKAGLFTCLSIRVGLAYWRDPWAEKVVFD